MNISSPNNRCQTDGGCSYMRSLSRLEQLAGFDLTAKAFEAIATECDGEGCYATCDARSEMARDLKPTSISVRRRSRRTVSSRSLAVTRAAAPIPFSRSALVDIMSDSQGNYVECRGLKIDSVSCPTSLSELYQYCGSLRATAGCRLSNLDPQHLIRVGIIGKLHIVDASSDDPAEFRYQLVGYAIPMTVPERPRAHPVAIYADHLLRDYNAVRLTSLPRLQRVRCRLASVYHHYTRLIVPFFDKRGRVSHLAVAVHLEPGDGMKLGSAAD